MPQKNRIALALTALVGLAFAMPAAPAQALPQPSVRSAEMGSARALPGWIDFCRRHPVECRVNPAEPAEIRLDQATWRLINTINHRVNATIRPLTDAEIFGIADYWAFPDSGYGDCEDYQLLKRKLLADAGLPRRAMRMTVVIDELGEGHAVLMIRTDRGDFILDNKIDAVLPWYRTGYVYVSREGQHSAQWTSLGHATGPSRTANR